jgi:hypothetical protein
MKCNVLKHRPPNDKKLQLHKCVKFSKYSVSLAKFEEKARAFALGGPLQPGLKFVIWLIVILLSAIIRNILMLVILLVGAIFMSHSA